MAPLALRRTYDPGAFPVPYAGDPTPSAVPAGYYGTDLLRARAVAIPPGDRPSQFVIADYLIGPAPDNTTTPTDATVLSAGLETVALLGQNTLQLEWFGDQQASAEARMAAWGITRFRYAVYQPNCYFSWDDQSSQGQIEAWAADIAGQITTELQVPLAQVPLYHMDDEGGWYEPQAISGINARPGALTKFHSYLATQGLTPADLGGTEWSDVIAIGYSAAITLPTRRLFYWSQRYVTHSYSEAMALDHAALRSEIGTQLFTTSNWNNLLRWYYPSPDTLIWGNPSSGPDAAAGAPEWFDYARTVGAGACLWTEDWFHNEAAEFWSYFADILRSAAQLASGVEFGGYVIGRTLDGGSPSVLGGRYKALALLGKGAKLMEWYLFGPTELFSGNGYSIYDFAYSNIADANRLIAHAEDLLYPGRPTAAPIAILLPISAQAWDVHLTGQGAPNPNAQETNLMSEMRGLHYALTQSGYAVDVLSEDDVPTKLDDYQVLYVTAPNLAAAAQAAIASWVAAGGVAWFGPGAAVADEYNTPTTTLDAIRGVTGQSLPRRFVGQDTADGYYGESPASPVTMTTLAVTVNGQALAAPGSDSLYRQLERLTVTTGTRLAQFADDNAAAVVYRATGSGYAISCGVWLGLDYLDTGRRLGPDPLLTDWDARLRGMLTLPARVAGITPRVTVDQPMVEPARLDSVGGIAVTLLNWSGVAIPALTVTVHDCPTIEQALLADSLSAVTFTQVGSDVTVVMALATVDILKLYAAA